MNKILCLLVVLAVTAQIYSAPAETGVDTAVKGAEGEGKQASDKVEKSAAGSAGDTGAAGGIMKAPMGMMTPFFTYGKDMFNDGEKLAKGVMGGFNPAGFTGKN